MNDKFLLLFCWSVKALLVTLIIPCKKTCVFGAHYFVARISIQYKMGDIYRLSSPVSETSYQCLGMPISPTVVWASPSVLGTGAIRFVIALFFSSE